MFFIILAGAVVLWSWVRMTPAERIRAAQVRGERFLEEMRVHERQRAERMRNEEILFCARTERLAEDMRARERRRTELVPPIRFRV